MTDDSRATAPRLPRGLAAEGDGLLLLDVADNHLDDAMEAVLVALGPVLARHPVYADEVRRALRRHADAGPDVLQHSVAVVHGRVQSAGPTVQVLVRFAVPLDLGGARGPATHFLWILVSNEQTHPLVAEAAEFALLMRDETFRAAVRSARSVAELRDAYRTARDLDLRFARSASPELRPMPGLFAGVRADLQRRMACYASDFRDGLRLKVLASIVFMFFACVAPAVAFGGLLASLTHGEIGPVEMILATAVCGVAWSLLAGQPLAIIGGTGPNVIFTGILYSLCVRLDAPFLPVVAWVGLWTMLFLLLLAATGASSLIRFFTRFTDETFAALISLIFIVQAVMSIVDLFTGHQIAYATALLSLVLALGTFHVAQGLSRFRRSPYLRRRWREFLADFGPTIAIVLASGTAYLVHEVELAGLPVPDELAPSVTRSWLVNPFVAPRWIWLGAAVPALFLTILIWVNQNITARLVNSPDLRLRKGSAYHLDIAVMGMLVGVMSLFGLPWVVGAVVRSLNHVRSLSIVRTRGDGHEEVEGVVETRLSNLGVHALMLLSLATLSVFRYVPMAVLFGLFLYMGVGSMSGNQFFERLRLWVLDPARYPPTHYLRAVPIARVHLFTLVQLVCLSVLWVVKVSPIGIAFPLLIALLVPVRMGMSRLFTPEHLALLDAEETPEEEVFREVE